MLFENEKLDITKNLRRDLGIMTKPSEIVYRMGVPGDGSCLIHALNSAAYQSEYLNSSLEKKQKLAIEQRNKLAKKLKYYINTANNMYIYLQTFIYKNYNFMKYYNEFNLPEKYGKSILRFLQKTEICQEDNFEKCFESFLEKPGPRDLNSELYTKIMTVYLKNTFKIFFRSIQKYIKDPRQWLGYPELLNIRDMYRRNIIVLRKNGSRYELYKGIDHDPQYSEYIVVLWVGENHFESIYMYDTNKNRNIRRFHKDHPFIEQLLKI